MTKSISLLVIFVAVFVFLGPTPVRADATVEWSRLETATSVLKEMAAMPEQGVPEALLDKAQGVAVIPSVIRAAFLVGGRYGEGVLVVRKEDGSWSNPSFVSLAGGSFGLQAGAEATDIVLVFKTKKSVEAIAGGKFTLGADISVAAGPVGRYAEASTDAQLKAEVYSYSRSRGLFAGVALQGAVLQIDSESNTRFYGSEATTAGSIFAGRVEVPAAARKFTCTLASYTRTPMRVCA